MQSFCVLTTPAPGSEGGLAAADCGLVTEPHHISQHILFLDPFHQVESRRLPWSDEAQPPASGERDTELSTDSFEPGFPGA